MKLMIILVTEWLGWLIMIDLRGFNDASRPNRILLYLGLVSMSPACDDLYEGAATSLTCQP